MKCYDEGQNGGCLEQEVPDWCRAPTLQSHWSAQSHDPPSIPSLCCRISTSSSLLPGSPVSSCYLFSTPPALLVLVWILVWASSVWASDKKQFNSAVQATRHFNSQQSSSTVQQCSYLECSTNVPCPPACESPSPLPAFVSTSTSDHFHPLNQPGFSPTLPRLVLITPFLTTVPCPAPYLQLNAHTSV